MKRNVLVFGLLIRK